jgi:Ca-activated chloride channel family protein
METRVKGSRSRAENDTFETARWKETGPWLVILLLPLAALAFRRGWLLSVSLDLWQRQDQQAHKALLAGEVERASELAKDPLRKGVAEFRKGDYEAAAEDFSLSDSAEAAYNKGNALAKLGKLQQAVDAYDQALKQQPGMQDAEYNREVVEKLLQQQKQSQQDQQAKQDKDDQQADQDKDNQQGDQAQKDKNNQKGEKGQQGKESEFSEGGQDQQQAEEKANAFSDAAEQAKKDAEGEEGEEAEQQGELAAKQREENESENDAEESRQSTAQSEQSQQGEGDDQQEKGRTAAEAEDLSSEEQIAAEQWLRRIPDDPAGLLRRKLRYQYIQRGGDSGKAADPQPW